MLMPFARRVISRTRRLKRTKDFGTSARLIAHMAVSHSTLLDASSGLSLHHSAQTLIDQIRLSLVGILKGKRGRLE